MNVHGAPCACVLVEALLQHAIPPARNPPQAFFDAGGNEAPAPAAAAPAAGAGGAPPAGSSLLAEAAAARAARAAAAGGSGAGGAGPSSSRPAGGGGGRAAAGNVRGLGDIGGEGSESDDDFNELYVGGDKRWVLPASLGACSCWQCWRVLLGGCRAVPGRVLLACSHLPCLCCPPLFHTRSGQVVRGGPKDKGQGGKGKGSVEDIFEGARAAGAEEVRRRPCFLLRLPACLPVGSTSVPTWLEAGLLAPLRCRRAPPSPASSAVAGGSRRWQRVRLTPLLGPNPPQGTYEDMYDDEEGEGEGAGRFKAFSGSARTLAGACPLCCGGLHMQAARLLTAACVA